MSDAEAATTQVVAAPAKKTPKKKSAAKAKKPANHPRYSDMVKQAIAELKDRSGSSRQAILKYIVAHWKVTAESAKNPLKMSLRAGVKNGSLKQPKGTGASGSYKLGDKADKPKAKKTKKATKTKAAGAKPKVKKVKKPKAAGAKKSPKKVKKAKKPAGEKKAKTAKPKTVKKAKKPKTPKKKAAAKK